MALYNDPRAHYRNFFSFGSSNHSRIDILDLNIIAHFLTTHSDVDLTDENGDFSEKVLESQCLQALDKIKNILTYMNDEIREELHSSFDSLYNDDILRGDIDFINQYLILDPEFNKLIDQEFPLISQILEIERD